MLSQDARVHYLAYLCFIQPPSPAFDNTSARQEWLFCRSGCLEVSVGPSGHAEAFSDFPLASPFLEARGHALPTYRPSPNILQRIYQMLWICRRFQTATATQLACSATSPAGISTAESAGLVPSKFSRTLLWMSANLAATCRHHTSPWTQGIVFPLPRTTRARFHSGPAWGRLKPSHLRSREPKQSRRLLASFYLLAVQLRDLSRDSLGLPWTTPLI